VTMPDIKTIPPSEATGKPIHNGQEIAAAA
jgi:hypothetical protein